jgi:hypothetical protein
VSIVLPYETDVVPGADRLAVVFPMLTPGGAPPPTVFREDLEGVRVHRLLLGSDPGLFVGPRGTMAGARAAVALIAAERIRLGVDKDGVIGLGTSFGAVCALCIGLRAGMARILVGGAPIDMGRQLRHLSRVDGLKNPAKAAAPEYLALAKGGEGGLKPVAFFNRLIYDAAAETTATVRIDLFVSRKDRAYESMRKFWKSLRSHPTVTCTFHTFDYGPHRDIREPYFSWVREQLASDS